MVSRQRLIEEVTISFPRAIDVSELESLMNFIVQNSDYNVGYTSSRETGLSKGDDGRVDKQIGPLLVKGSFSSTKNFVNHGFNSILATEETNLDRIKGIRFFRYGYHRSLISYGSDTLDLWRNIRQQVANYFRQKEDNL